MADQTQLTTDYHAMVLALEAPAIKVTQHVAQDERVARLLHSFIGIATEVGELLEALRKGGEIDYVNLCEELGDAYFYVFMGLNVVGVECQNADTLVFSQEKDKKNPEVILASILSSVVVSMQALDYLKKVIAYGRPLDEEEAKNRLSNVFISLDLICSAADFLPSDCLKANMAKLAKRYPNGFTQERAENRDLAAEREVLEAHQAVS